VALLGRSTFYFEPHLDTALISILLSVASGLVASLFPVRKALQIEPVVAMRRG
jgi:ABC-type antimicrobial peptide transport system permease subunit